MIAASGLLVIVAFVTLILGIFQSGLSLIYVSIAASVLAAISLATGVVRTRPRTVSVGGETLGTWGSTASPVLDRPDEAQPEPAAAEEAPVTAVLPLVEEPEPEERAPARPAARKAPAKKVAKAAGAAKKAAAGQAMVVVIPDRDKFHRSSCRYAKGQATQTMSKVAARREGYKPCGVCKP